MSTRITGQSTETAILLDVETTGLDRQKDEIIELGMAKFDYLPGGHCRAPGCLLVIQGAVQADPAGCHRPHRNYERDRRGLSHRRGGGIIVRRGCRDRHRPQCRIRPQISRFRAKLGGVRRPGSNAESTASGARASATC